MEMSSSIRRTGIIFLAVVVIAAMTVFIGNNIVSANAQEIAPVYKYYTSIPVKKGDTLWGIANEHMTAEYTDIDEYIREIKTLNHLTEDSIHAGEYLTIPYYSSDIL